MALLRSQAGAPSSWQRCLLDGASVGLIRGGYCLFSASHRGRAELVERWARSRPSVPRRSALEYTALALKLRSKLYSTVST